MKLRHRLLLSVGTTLLLLVTGVYFLTSKMLISSYEELEERNTLKNADRAIDLFAQELSKVAESSTELANREQTAEFFVNRNQQYISENITVGLSSMDAIVFIKPDMSVWYSKSNQTGANAKPVDVDALLSSIKDSSIFVKNSSTRTISGFVQHEANPVSISIRRVQSRNPGNALLGWVVLGRYLDLKKLHEFEYRTHLSVDLFDLQKRLPKDCDKALTKLSDRSPTFTQPVNDQKVAGYFLIKNIYNKNIRLVRLLELRSLYNKGRESVSVLIGLIVLASIAFSIVIMVVLEISTLTRLTKLQSQVEAISETTDGAGTIEIGGKDELAWLANSINSMVQSIQRNRELEHAYSNLAEVNQILENAMEGISQMDGEGKFVACNSSFSRILGYSPDEILHVHWESIVWPDEVEKMRRVYRQMQVMGKAQSEILVRPREGEHLFAEVVLIAQFDEADRFNGSYCFIKDISERRRLEEQIEHQAFHDSLTGLPNRTLFLERLVYAQEHAMRNRKSVAVVFTDLDNFKIINDSFGHEAGDVLLKSIAERLKQCIRPGDTVARFGGDEFVMLLTDLDTIEDAKEVAETAIRSLANPIVLAQGEVVAGGSMGIAFSTENEFDSDELLRDADTAMYRAKSLGKSTYVVFDSSMNAEVVERMEIEIGLRQAIEKGEFNVVYQPIVNVKTGYIAGAEALLRWNSPQRGTVPPEIFIPIAEETGLINPIGTWVLYQACSQAVEWLRETSVDDTFCVSVNLSGKQLQRPDICKKVMAILEDTGLPANRLKLEITESVLMDDMEEAVDKLRQLKELGIKLAIDDFGTGYSSMSSLSSFPLDTVKIDRSFMLKIGVEPEATAVVSAIIMLSKAMNLDVTAEGVEEYAQYEHLIEQGCQTVQGYYFDRPMQAEDIVWKFGVPYCITPPNGYELEKQRKARTLEVVQNEDIAA